MLHHASIRTAGLCAASIFFLSNSALALNNRSWVSHTGSDINPCFVTSPCKTFQHAHDITAAGGEVDALDPGDYGIITINKAITIDGANMGYIQLLSDPAAIQVVAGGARVVIRNLSIIGVPGSSAFSDAIQFKNGAALFVEGVSINGVGQSGIATALPPPSSDGPAPVLYVTNVFIRNCGNTGISLRGAIVNGIQGVTNVTATVDHAVIENVDTGIGVQTGRANVTHTLISHANFAGVAVTNSGVLPAPGGEVNLEDSSISYSKFGIFSTFAGSMVRIAGDNIHDNANGLFFNGGEIVSFGNNRVLGNASAETPSSTVALK